MNIKALLFNKLWFHYFFSVPFWAMGFKPQYIFNHNYCSDWINEQILTNEIEQLRAHLASRFTNKGTEEIIRLYKIVTMTRESDSFKILGASPKNIESFFYFKGLEQLKEAYKTNKAIVLLASHMGSLYSSCIGLGLEGLQVYPIARSVDHSASTPWAHRIYFSLNYHLTGHKLSGKYIFTNFNAIQKDLVTVINNKKICVNAIDIPPTLYPKKRQKVTFLERPSSMPASFVNWAVRKNVLFFTMWNRIQIKNKSIIRHIEIKPISSTNPSDILQEYANRLTAVICQEPWQWMPLCIASQYHEPY